jgi:hypothetical protein
MSTNDGSFTDMWSGFLASVWTQVRAAQVVGLPAEDESRSVAAHETIAGDQITRPEVRSMDDYAGYLTGSGLGSLDIGGGSSRWGE